MRSASHVIGSPSNALVDIGGADATVGEAKSRLIKPRQHSDETKQNIEAHSTINAKAFLNDVTDEQPIEKHHVIVKIERRETVHT
ncbi:hypothetical protein CHUAL_013171 [Chamberlinius hualienensis]